MDHDYFAPDELDGSPNSAQEEENRIQRLARRLPGDVRIHNTSQAGELARQLGARAFTVGRDIYVRPDLVQPMTPEGESLLAHEMYHVAEQTGLASVEMPLLSPPATLSPSGRGVTSGPPSEGAPATPVQRVAVQREDSGSASSEAQAENVEMSQLQGEPAPRQRREQAPIDPEQLAERVYKLMARDLILDKERGVDTW